MVSRVGLSLFREAVLTGASRQSQPPLGPFTGTSLGGRLDPIQSRPAQELKGSEVAHNCRRPSQPLKALFSSKKLERDCAQFIFRLSDISVESLCEFWAYCFFFFVLFFTHTEENERKFHWYLNATLNGPTVLRVSSPY